MQKALNGLQQEGTNGQVTDFLCFEVGECSFEVGMMLESHAELIQQLVVLVNVHHVPLHTGQPAHTLVSLTYKLVMHVTSSYVFTRDSRMLRVS